jgi:hypothetical protein
MDVSTIITSGEISGIKSWYWDGATGHMRVVGDRVEVTQARVAEKLGAELTLRL